MKYTLPFKRYNKIKKKEEEQLFNKVLPEFVIFTRFNKNLLLIRLFSFFLFLIVNQQPYMADKFRIKK